MARRAQVGGELAPAALPSAGERRMVWLLIAAALGPLTALVLLHTWHVPLGCPGRLVYLYSPVNALRLGAVPIAIGLAVALGLGVWLTGSSAAPRRRAGLGLAILGAVALACWTYLAPPSHHIQHLFNSQSPSQDGAFAVEATQVTSVRDYLHGFPQRARTPPAAMRGTRVISNPPGATLLAIGVDRLVRQFPGLGQWALGPAAADLPPGDMAAWVRQTEAVGLLFFWVLTGLWLVAGLFFYLAGRLFWSPVVALAYSLCCVFTPMTLLFTPGKDPAQLLTAALPLYFWLLALRRQRAWSAVLAGLLFSGACVVSLVHVWIAAAVVAATLLTARPWAPAGRQILVRLLAPACAGAVLGVATLYVFCGLDLPATVRAVAAAQAAVTRGPDAMPLRWQLLGLPLFLLFAGPAWWTALLWSACSRPKIDAKSDNAAGFGFYLLLATAVAMLGTVGFTNLETARLWIPFVPLLLLGGLLRSEALRHPTRRIARLLAALVAVQVAVAALQWSFMDMRETETRLAAQRYFG